MGQTEMEVGLQNRVEGASYFRMMTIDCWGYHPYSDCPRLFGAFHGCQSDFNEQAFSLVNLI